MEFIPAKTIISSANWNGWFGMNYNMNIYKGCNHGCIYCDSRSECYRIDDFDRVRAKENAIEIIEQELFKKRKTGVVGTGAMSDPYNSFEKKYKLTRQALKLINKYGYGVGIATKSDLILRDLDILKEISKHSPVLIKITITTADDSLAKMVETNVAVSSRRFATIKELSANGIFTGVLMMPILPFIGDNEDNIRKIVNLAYSNGAKFIYPGFGMTLRTNQREWYYKKLDNRFSGLEEKYIKSYGQTYECRSKRWQHLQKVFVDECDRLGILYKMDDIIEGYKGEYSKKQLSLFK